MPDGYALTLEVGVGNSGLASSGPGSSRVLTLSKPDVAPWASAICALIGGEALGSAQAYEEIDATFRRGTAAGTLLPGAEERYIEGVLSPYAGGPVGIALVLWIGATAYLSWVGGYGSSILQSTLLRDARDLIPDGATDHIVPVLRLALNPLDHLVLADDRVMRCVQANEMRETLLRPTQSLSLQGEAAWLSALAEERSGEASNAVVLRFSSSAPARPSGLGSRRMLLSFLAGVVAVVVVVLALFFRAHAVRGHVTSKAKAQGLVVYQSPKQILPAPTPLPILVSPKPRRSVRFSVPANARPVPPPVVQRHTAARPTVQLPAQRPTPRVGPPRPIARPVV